MSALARTSESDCRTRTTGENCTASESWTRTKYFYDNLTTAGGAWGNLTSISPPSSSYNGCVQESGLSTLVSSNNQLSQSSNFCYDSAGNLVLETACPTGSFTPTYSYDAENHLVSAVGTNYLYDGDGRRVEKSVSGSVTKIYWYDPSNQVLDETDGSGSATNSAFNEYVFFGSQRIARRDSSNNAYYYFADHLGTSRTIAEVPAGQSTATLCYDSDFYSFGGERTPIVNTCSQNYKFTGKERDAESGLDNFGARFDASSFGRFMSPDWSDDPDPIPNADLANPQTLNLYTYVANNPLNLTDDDGHDPGDPNPAGTCGWLCRFFNLFRNSNTSSTEQAGLTPLPRPGSPSIQPSPVGPSGPPKPSPNQPLPTAQPSKAAGAALAGTLGCQIAEPCGIGEDLVIGAALITAGVMLGHDAYVHHKEQAQIRAAAEAATRQTGLRLTYEQFSEYLHQYKDSGGRGPGDNYTFAKLVLIAKEAAQWYETHK